MPSNALGKPSFSRRPAPNRKRTPALRIVPEQNKTGLSKTKLSLVFLTIAALVVLILTPLLINTQLAVLSYEIHQDQVELAKVQENNALLQSEINQQGSAERVRAMAEENGLVPAGETGYITLSKKQVKGGAPAQAVVEDEEATQPSNKPDAHTRAVNDTANQPTSEQKSPAESE